ncbi:hypothetical protein EJ04DRAFT_444333, partial [Polyplosphaeria fusca]
RELGDELPKTLDSMNSVATMYIYKGQWKEAKELFVQVVKTSLRVLGGEHPDTLVSMDNLAFTLNNQGWCKDAEELYMKVMETRKRVVGDKHPDTLISKAILARYKTQGRLKEAKQLEV